MALTSALTKYIKAYRSLQHSDGTMFDDMFIVVFYINEKQCSYHYSIKYWDDFKHLEIREKAEPWNGTNPNDTYGKFGKIPMDNCESDSGGCSRSLHQIGYLDSELDLVIFASKVSSQERNIGLKKDLEIDTNNNSNPISIKNTQINTSTGKIRNIKTSTKNNHPTLKPIKLIYQIAKLLKTPIQQSVFSHFPGLGLK